MRKCGIALLVACLLSAVASSGQSLAEVAKKERERRAQAGKGGNPAAVISEKELEEARGDSLSVSGTASEEPSSGPPAEAAGDAEANAGSKLTAKDIRDLREEWARIWQGQMSQAEQELEQAKDDVYQCRSAERYFFVPVAVDCDGVDLRLAGAEARLKKVKSNRYHWELLLPGNPNP
jgi:hypothetical protein